MADESLPYKAEYAKSGRASCKACKENIAKDTLRLAAMVQSPMFDGKTPNWYHYKCFFTKQRPSSIADIDNFDAIKYEDQQKIQTKLEAALSMPAPTKGKGKGKATPQGGLKEFSVEVAKAGRAGCQGCQQKVLKGEVRISKMDYTSDSARRYGPMPRWHHVTCFVQLRESLDFYEAAKDIPGFYAMPADVQDSVAAEVKPIKRKAKDEVDSAPPAKKPKKEDEELMKKQSKAIYKYRDLLKALNKKELTTLMSRNVKDFSETGHGESKLLDMAADMLTFGATEPCEQCGGLLLFQSGTGYACTGYLSEYTRCPAVVRQPKRKPAYLASGLRKEYAFLSSYAQPKLGARLFIDRGPSSVVMAATHPTIVRPNTRPLAGLSFVLAGGDTKAGKAAVEKLSGTVKSTVGAATAAVITDKAVLAAGGKVVKKAESLGVQCVGENFLEEAKAAGDQAAVLLLIKKLAISEWGSDVEARVSGSKLYKSIKSVKSKFEKSGSDKLKVTLKNGGAVDPDSELQDQAHVLKYHERMYNSVLGAVDITKGTNSYYKLQVLESDRKDAYWVFRAWGRIGTTIGSNKLEEMDSLHEAVRHFHGLFEEKTGNHFKSEKYEKVAGRFSVLDVDYGEDKQKIQKMIVSQENSSLPLSVQQLVALIFDVDNMKNQMMEFEIDLKKLPLGKLSQTQLTSAFKVLTEAQAFLEEDSKTNGPKLLDCSNKFYTLIPHDFGLANVPVFDSLKMIQSKIEMIESLKEIELAYSILSGTTEAGKSVIDSHYAKLNTKIEPLDHDSKEMSVVKEYVANTHGATHQHYKLAVQDVFKVARAGEAKRFKPFKKLHNHQLLWHGSRLTNYAGILSQGLRIAPPEAPCTGYMFGKGIYFADMVSKSANYCNASSANSTGIMLLCDVALGDMYERTKAEFVKKLESGKHSCKGLGTTAPSSMVELDGAQVPLGTPANVDVKSSLLYNEFIVYDTAQVQMKYLIKLKFEYD